jgi:hypothetical protein
VKSGVYRSTYDRRPTPAPLIIRPKTITPKPVVNVCTAPPIVNTNAPTKSVPFRPITSPTRPAARDVAKSEFSLPGTEIYTEDVPNAPTSNTATILPTCIGPGALKKPIK